MARTVWPTELPVSVGSIAVILYRVSATGRDHSERRCARIEVTDKDEEADQKCTSLSLVNPALTSVLRIVPSREFPVVLTIKWLRFHCTLTNLLPIGAN